ncbi:hypothetical protein [Intrasporangium sp. DVR]|uniref:hypothetical protein n=1 Tax=Intrasporangium sp. DVR TaxID=3127867 RepID=UPI00313A6D3B
MTVDSDYKGTESFSNTVGDSVSYTFTGPAIQVVMPQSENRASLPRSPRQRR